MIATNFILFTYYLPMSNAINGFAMSLKDIVCKTNVLGFFQCNKFCFFKFCVLHGFCIFSDKNVGNVFSIIHDRRLFFEGVHRIFYGGIFLRFLSQIGSQIDIQFIQGRYISLC